MEKKLRKLFSIFTFFGFTVSAGLSLAVILAVSSATHAAHADVFVSQNVLRTLKSEKRADVLVFFNEKALVTQAETIIDRTQRIQFVYDQLRHVAQKSQAAFIADLQEQNLSFRSFYIVNAVLVENVNEDIIELWKNRSELSMILLDVKTKVKDVPVDQKQVRSLRNDIDPQEIPDNIKAVNADQVWKKGFLGKGIVIAGQDSGYQWDHPALISQYRGKSAFFVRHDYNWHDAIHKAINSERQPCGYDLSAPCDDRGHGTHTMGSIVGFDYATKTNRIGVAPEAQWMGCRNMDSGVGKASTYLECFEFLLAPYPWKGNPQTDGDPSYAPHIVNNSWACTSEEGCTGNEFIEAVQNFKAAGIAVVVSAGNDGSGCGSMQNPPGFYTGEIFSVAAFDHRNNKIADFSSRGPSKWNQKVGPNISAPGEMIRSAVNSKDLYDYKSGTSMAGPHVAGVLALLWSARPELIGQIDRSMEIIQKSAQPKTSSQTCSQFRGNDIPNAVFGYGLIDALKAINYN